jgi:ADP-ribosylation factor protein 1
LHQVCSSEELQDAKILVFANKQDLPNAMNAGELMDALKLNDLKQQWFLQPCCATTGEGLFEGIEWLSQL